MERAKEKVHYGTKDKLMDQSRFRNRLPRYGGSDFGNSNRFNGNMDHSTVIFYSMIEDLCYLDIG